MAGGPSFMVNHVLNYRFPWKAHIAARDGYWAVPVVLTYIRLGDLAISPLGAEVFNAISSVVKRSTDSQPTIFTSVSSRCIGYLPTAEEQARGGYEADTYWYFYRMPGRLKADSAERELEAVQKLATDSAPT